MSSLEKTKIQLGYIPLLDCIALLWAKRRGFFEEFGLDVTLVKEASWASLRDRLAFGVLDAAHCLSAMLPAAAVADDQIGIQLKTPLVLSINRAYISLNQHLSYTLAIETTDSAQMAAQKLVDHINQGHPVALAHVFKHSIHHYCLREWLALANQNLAQNIVLKTLPPPYLVEALSSGLIDGFCVGEPWNTQGEIEGVSQIVASSRDIIPAIADKVLAVTSEWASQHPNTLIALTAAVIKAQKELETLQNFEPVWQILSEFNIIRFECSPQVHVKKYYAIESIIRHFVDDSAVPDVEHFVWLFEQMQKWENIEIVQNNIEQLSNSCIHTATYLAAREKVR
ncbi:ABC transporter substrate-binding protein [Acinetobacter sp. S40]|uniref:ABC transporter substrate-binding protein n=1 Tax=unclassified Acinetobacter TaxID=196816 RepID=UPI00190AB027|nr:MULTISPECIES: ABC transporter substrate-binding protein [unclassified Acinetobacter]MBJ9985191.1 ABC transporter substrate-binding protein [Acinetobacter sp. S40]MBK0063323.1 ABC transporter substrate-binding protein [Acinetobacter sp. S55]MBK0066765.1 ABC transporter substrate-binding protein [Acinetobacter sp. S54]